jgi:hypothetical protein
MLSIWPIPIVWIPLYPKMHQIRLDDINLQEQTSIVVDSFPRCPFSVLLFV